MNFGDEEILNGFINRDNKVMCYLYKKYFPLIEQMVLKFDGNIHDTSDIFQDSLILIYMNIEEFKKNKSKFNFGSIFFTIARNKQRDLLRHRQSVSFINNFISPEVENEVSFDITGILEEEEKVKLYEKHFKFLNYECQKLLKYSLQNLTLKEITRRMKFKTEDYTKHRRYKCKEFLMNSIYKDPIYSELKYE